MKQTKRSSQCQFWRHKPNDASPDQSGQGLTEYALLLVLVGMAVIASLSLVGPTLSNVFEQVQDNLAGRPPDQTDTLVITRADYNPGNQKLHLDLTSDGGTDPGTILTVTPGGQMSTNGNHYHLKWTIGACPCTVTVTSSLGGTASVTVGN